MTINWLELTLPPINLWNTPRRGIPDTGKDNGYNSESISGNGNSEEEARTERSTESDTDGERNA